MAESKSAQQNVDPTIADEKAAESIRIRISADLKSKLKDTLQTHPSYGGNLSEFLVDCVKAWILQHRRGEQPVYPLEFLVDYKHKP